MSQTSGTRVGHLMRSVLGFFHVAVPTVDSATRNSLREYVPFSDRELRDLIQEGYERRSFGQPVAVWDGRCIASWSGVATVLLLGIALVGSFIGWPGIAVPLLILGAMLAFKVALARGVWHLLYDPRALDFAIVVKECQVRESYNSTHFKSLIEHRHLWRERSSAESMTMEIDREIAGAEPEMVESLRLQRLHYERFGAFADDQIAQLRLEQAEAKRLQQEILDHFTAIRCRLNTADAEAVLVHAREASASAEKTVAAAELHRATRSEEIAKGLARLKDLEVKHRRHLEEAQLAEKELA